MCVWLLLVFVGFLLVFRVVVLFLFFIVYCLVVCMYVLFVVCLFVRVGGGGGDNSKQFC